MIRKLAPMLVVVAIATMSFGCGDDKVCEDFNVPIIGSECAESSACSEFNCQATCSSSVSDATGAAFCEDQTCVCPCRICADVQRF